MKFSCLTSILISFLASGLYHYPTSAVELPQPPVWDHANDAVMVLELDWLEVDPGFGGPPFSTRALGGSVPGPTIKVNAGRVLEITFKNQLEQQQSALDSPSGWNQPNGPDTANLHFHGGHVTPVLPGDDTTLTVPPGEEYIYTIPIPEQHLPGTHWLHSHHHGSTSLHLGGGAACTLIVKDPPGSLAEDVEAAEEVILVFQDWDTTELILAAGLAGDENFKDSLETIEGPEEAWGRFITVNGQYQPTISVQRGVWYRWRVLYAGWQDLLLNLREMKSSEIDINADCEFQLLAKDGIYIKDYPRALSELPIPPGGRADVMFRCNGPADSRTIFETLGRRKREVEVFESDPSTNSTDNIDTDAIREGSEVMTRSASTSSEAPLTPWTGPEMPDYLEDLMGSHPSNGCTCSTNMKGYGDESKINYQPYRAGNYYLHTSYLGAINERVVSDTTEHSYHQHVYPFQIISGFLPDRTDYLREGDWHDTLMASNGYATSIVIRYRTTDLAGKILVHCHSALHADFGMIAKEYVMNVGEEEGECQCEIKGPIDEGLVGVIEDSLDRKQVVNGIAELMEETKSASSDSEENSTENDMETNSAGTTAAWPSSLLLISVVCGFLFL